jgi:energy-coupling factor transporter ATP-binding protein EcfA2
MIKRVSIRSFKTLENVEVDLGNINVFIGANGSGKSNLLEAIGVLSAAADGKVNDQVLLQRGVRPGVPSLYKSSFPSVRDSSRHIFLKGESDDAEYRVSLHNPLRDPSPSWKFKTEALSEGCHKLASRGPNMAEAPNKEHGLAALKVVELKEGNSALSLMRRLQNYAIYTPTTAVLRGVASETQPRQPIGLSGGNLPNGINELLAEGKSSDIAKLVYQQSLQLISWATDYSSGKASELPLSPSANATPRVIRFVDKFMQPSRNILSGYDASEGALYILFLALLAGHSKSPEFCAIDNVDYGLNPGLASQLIYKFSNWFLMDPNNRQVLITSHNPAVLDGLPLTDDRVRLFIVDRDNKGKTYIKRIEITEKLLEKAKNGWTLSRLWMSKIIGGMPDV